MVSRDGGRPDPALGPRAGHRVRLAKLSELVLPGADGAGRRPRGAVGRHGRVRAAGRRDRRRPGVRPAERARWSASAQLVASQEKKLGNEQFVSRAPGGRGGRASGEKLPRGRSSARCWCGSGSCWGAAVSARGVLRGRRRPDRCPRLLRSPAPASSRRRAARPTPTPPQLIATRPDSFARLPGFQGRRRVPVRRGDLRGRLAQQGTGTGDLEKLVILSPTTRVPDVSWRRTGSPCVPTKAGAPTGSTGWSCCRASTDLGATGARGHGADLHHRRPAPATTLEGTVVDWTTSPARRRSALVVARAPARQPALSRRWPTRAGHISFGPLPAGEYLVSRRAGREPEPAWPTVARHSTASGWLAGRPRPESCGRSCTTRPRPASATVTVGDSVSAIDRAEPDRLDPRQRLAPRSAVRGPAARLDARSRWRRSCPSRWTTACMAAAAAKPDTTAPRYHQPATRSRRTPRPLQTGAPGARRRGRGAQTEPLTTRPPLSDRLVLRVPRPWTPGAQVRDDPARLRNVTGVAGDAVGTGGPRARRPRDSARGRRFAARAPGLAAEVEAGGPSSRPRSSRQAAEASRADRRRDRPAAGRFPRWTGSCASPRWPTCWSIRPARVVVDAVRESLAAARTRRAGPPGRLGGRGPRAPGRPQSRRAAAGAQRHRRRPPHQPRAGRRSPPAAVAAMAPRSRAGYSNLELDLDAGYPRQPHTTIAAACSASVTGAEDALVVNNAAGALVLALNALAAGREVADLARRADRDRRLVPDSRHHGAERRPAARGRDHQPHPPGRLSAGPGCRRGRILTVHRSNFEQRGFVASPEPAELAALAARGRHSLSVRRGQRAPGGSVSPGASAASRGWPTRSARGADLVAVQR